MADQLVLPQVPVRHSEFLDHVMDHFLTPMAALLRPYDAYDHVLRRIFAQDRFHPALEDNTLNLVPLYIDGYVNVLARGRDRPPMTDLRGPRANYIFPLKTNDRRPQDSRAVVRCMGQFERHLDTFTEKSLTYLDWNNVVVAGGAVAASLMPIPEEYRGSQRLLRRYYHEKYAPTADVDLYLYGLTEEQAIEKIKQIEASVTSAISHETVTVRTKNTITIVSQYPTRHVQIVLRLYKSIAEILTGFDVDCSCAAYDGKQVYVAPRALASYMSQVNRIDLTRRSPSYENRLFKYSRRGFETYWPTLDRTKIDPAIYEESRPNVVGLARLLVYERFPDRNLRFHKKQKKCCHRGNSKGEGETAIDNDNLKWNHEVPEPYDADEESNYNTVLIPYGKGYNARKIRALLYKRDYLLNVEWNNTERNVKLHRHPVFCGDAVDVFQDCCGNCPKPVTLEEKEVAEKESKFCVSGKISFIHDNPGGQEIGEFNPATEYEWTEMAYIGNTQLLNQAIVDCNLNEVKALLGEDDSDPNRGDYTGRTPLHLASIASTPRVVQFLVDHGARLTARLADGKTALHLAASRGSVEIVRILLMKSKENEERERTSEHAHGETQQMQGQLGQQHGVEDDIEMSNDSSTQRDDNTAESDIYNVDDLTWDNHMSPLHLAILNGHDNVVEELVSSFAADISLPVKSRDRGAPAIPNLGLAVQLPLEKAKTMVTKLLQLGASPAQTDSATYTVLHYLAALPDHTELLDILLDHDEFAVKRIVNHVCHGSSPLTMAISAKNALGVHKLLEMGARPTATSSNFSETGASRCDSANPDGGIVHPVALAMERNMPLAALELIGRGADVNTICHAYTGPDGSIDGNLTQLDYVRKGLEHLRIYEGQTVTVTSPSNLPMLDSDDSHYLGEFGNDSYKLFSARQQLQAARNFQQFRQEDHGRHLAKSKQGKGLDENSDTIGKSIEDYAVLEKALVEMGAQPSGPSPRIVEQPGAESTLQPAFHISFEFLYPNLTDVMKDGYVRLFEAAWHGDIDTIRQLTSGKWGVHLDQPPLEISVRDRLGFSPFSVAVLRGHRTAAGFILEVVRSQYRPFRSEHARVVKLDNDDASDSEDSDELQLHRENTTYQPTTEGVEEITSDVSRNVSPLEVLSWKCPAGLFLHSNTNRDDRVDNLLRYALYLRDTKLLSFLLDLQEKFSGTRAKISVNDFQAAIAFESFDCLEEMIRRTAAGISLDDLVRARKVEISETSKYYKGLSVYGQKRPDMMIAPSLKHSVRDFNNISPPLLVSAAAGSINGVKWFLSSEPKRLYMEYVNTHKDDRRVERLLQANTGIEMSITSWLDLRGHLVLHCAVLSEETDESVQLVQYLAENAPTCLEAKSSYGLTPLALSFALHRGRFARILINFYANQEVRTANGNNILHLLLRDNLNKSCTNPRSLRQLLGLISPPVVPSLLVGLSSDDSGYMTPLCRWLRGLERPHNTNHALIKAQADVLRLILEFAKPSRPRHLHLMDGMGDTPMHIVIKSEFPHLLEVMLQYPRLLQHEDATGRTPWEVAVDGWIDEVASCPPGANHESPKVSMYESCLRVLANEQTRKRKVVTSYEANVVANRLRLERPIPAVAVDQSTIPPQNAANGPTRKRKLGTTHEADVACKRMKLGHKPDRTNHDEVGRWYGAPHKWWLIGAATVF